MKFLFKCTLFRIGGVAKLEINICVTEHTGVFSNNTSSPRHLTKPRPVHNCLNIKKLNILTKIWFWSTFEQEPTLHWVQEQLSMYLWTSSHWLKQSWPRTSIIEDSELKDPEVLWWKHQQYYYVNFSVAKLTLQSPMSIRLSVCKQNPSPSFIFHTSLSNF